MPAAMIPALYGSSRPLPSSRANPSAICERQELPVQRNMILVTLLAMRRILHLLDTFGHGDLPFVIDHDRFAAGLFHDPDPLLRAQDERRFGQGVDNLAAVAHQCRRDDAC